MEKNLRNDSRFAHVATDPRFRRVPKSERKVKIDKRFESMFSDNKFKLKYSLDKRGRPAAHSTSDDLRRYYELSSEESNKSDSSDSDSEEEEDEEEEDVKEDVEKSRKKSSKEEIIKASSKEDGDNDEEEFHTDDEEKVPLSEAIIEKIRSRKIDYARGEGVIVSDSSSDEESSENESEVDIREIDHEWGELDRDAERTDEVTNRLAVCNMDWDRIRASDLMVLFSSFMPPGGVIHSVTIYPSEFGVERMKHDDLSGPAELLADEPVEPGEFNKEGLPPDDKNEEGKKFNMERLRQYQLTRLKYYYAVIVFDSAESANKIYVECDSTEYESSSARLDLRFIPDDTVFDQEPKETCEQMPEPSKYEPLRFTTSALHQGKVQLTWDETDPFRVAVSNRIAAGTADEADLQAFIASSSGEEDEEENEKESTMEVKAPKSAAGASISKYRALLSNIEEEEKAKEKQDVGLQVTWGLDLKRKAKRLVSQKLKSGPDGPTPFEQIIQKKEEKKRKKREDKKLKKASKAPEGEEEAAISDDELPSDIDMNDPFFKDEMQGDQEPKTKKEMKKEKRKELRKERKKEKIEKLAEEDTEESKQRKAELELLLMESEDERQHFSLKQIMESEEATSGKKKKKKKKWSKADKPVVEDNFQIDVKDERFSALFSSHHFSIDPTDPKYRKTSAMELLIAEKLKRKQSEKSEAPQDQQDQAPTKKAKKTAKMDSELSNLVATLKKQTAGKFKS